MAYNYRVTGAGFVEVEQPDGSWLVIQPSSADVALFHDHVEQWAPLALEAEHKYGVPAGYILATIQSESGGNPNRGPTFDGGVGLMMLTSAAAKQGHSNDELKDPALNIDLGTRLASQAFAIVGDDVPKLASAFNAGWSPTTGPHPNARAPWGFEEYELRDKDGNRTGVFPYITRVVKLSNYAREWLGENTTIEQRDSGGFWAVVKKAITSPGVLAGIAIGIGVAVAQTRRA